MNVCLYLVVFVLISGVTAYSGFFIPSNTSQYEKAGFCISSYNSGDHELVKYIENELKIYGSKSEQGDQYIRTSETYHDSPGDEVCHTKHWQKALKIAKANDNKWYYIVNTDTFIQNVIIGLCNPSSEDGACSDIRQEDYDSKCIQKTVTRYLHVIDHNGELVQKDLHIPTYCMCAIRKKRSEQ